MDTKKSFKQQKKHLDNIKLHLKQLGLSPTYASVLVKQIKQRIHPA